ncbi:MAG: hypothetical protein C5B48_11860 [Candidatus Rokuibacteriota bacterium]|nr:MAG: hypothetical protein C5B48_11860 [Candidatus Rokubacteria bacterium]
MKHLLLMVTLLTFLPWASPKDALALQRLQVAYEHAQGEEALKALRGLRAMTANRPTYSQYLGRLAYTKARVDLLLLKLSDTGLKSAVAASLRFFTGAADIWGEVLWVKANRPVAKERAQEVRAAILKLRDDCAALKRLESASGDEIVDGAVEATWSCASDKITDAEKLLGEMQARS